MDYSASALSCAQQGVYIDCILHPDKLNYNIPYGLTFSNLVSPQKLAEATSRVLACHPSLYSVFENREEKAVQVYSSERSTPVNIRNVADDEVPTAKASFVRCFDIEHGPLCRAEVLATPTATILLLDIHHLVCDGTSMNLLLHEICSTLEGSAPAEEQQGYAAFAEAQQNNTVGHKAYYDHLLAEVEPTSLPTDLNGGDGGHKEIVLAVSADNVMDHAKTMGTAPSALFMSAAFYTLARYANTKSVCMTTISNGRLNPLTKGVVGMFVNTMPMVSKLEDVTVKEYILKTREMFVETRQHEEYPFGNLVNDYGIEQKARFTYQYGTYKPLMVDGQEVKRERLRTNDHENPFTITINEVEGKPAIIINYDSALYSEAMINRFAESMDAVVSHFIDNPEARLLSVSIMSAAQEEELKELRHTCLDAEAIRFNLFHRSVEYWAEQTPDATAIIACNETLTYRQLNEKANILAHALINKGVVPGDRICLLLPRKSWHLIAMFGVMKTGSAYIPCDPEYPAERINLITEDSHARYVITTSDKMEPYGDRALNIEDILAEDMPTTNPGIEQSSDSLAYLIYTSGSTGRPKGVMLHHRGICNYLTPHKENRHIHAFVSECQMMMGLTTVSFDLSLKEIGATMYNGKTLVFANEDEIMSPILMTELFKRTGCDGFNGTPSRLKMFLEWPDFEEVIKNVKVIILGGEKYPATLIPQLRSLTKARLFNTYGPTEITVSSNVGELTNEEKVMVGEPLLNYHEYVVDADDNELPVGIVGELLIGGLAVGKGYNDLPEKTAEAFIEYQGQRVYRSGDYARWTDSGKVEILGRKDHQIKLNGLRIEIGEVETVLNRQPQVKEGVVMIKTVKGHDHLVAYYTVVEDVTKDQLKAQMSSSLTHYMVPTVFMQLDRMPISPNGKTDLKALPEPVVGVAAAQKVMPVTEVEKALYDIISEIVGNSDFGTTTNLISAGLTSLLAMRLSVLVSQKMNASLSVRDILRCPTVKELVDKMEINDDPSTGSGQAPDNGNSVAFHRHRQGSRYPICIYPLSENQRGVYFDWELHRDALQYNMPSVTIYDTVDSTDSPNVDAKRLRDAIRAAVNAHPQLKTRLVMLGEDVMQQAHPELVPQVPIFDLRDMCADCEHALADLGGEFWQNQVLPYDLFNDCLYRYTIYTYDSKVILFADRHHIVSDGISNGILERDIWRAYNGETLQMEDYTALDNAVDLLEKMQSPEFAEAEKFFDETLSGVSTTSYPHSMNEEQDGASGKLINCGRRVLTLDMPAKAISDYCRVNAVTQSNFFLTAFTYVLHRTSLQKNVFLTTVNNGREDLRLSDSVGMFVRTIPVVSRMPEGTVTTVLDAVKAMQDQQFTTQSYDFYPFTRMVARYGVRPEIMFVYQSGIEANGHGKRQNLQLDTAKMPIEFMIFGKSKDTFQLYVSYDAAFYTDDAMNMLLQLLALASANMLEAEIMNSVSFVNAEGMDLLAAFHSCHNVSVSGDNKVKTPASEKQSSASDKQSELVASANKTEEDFCNIFAEVLELDNVCPTDNFFEIGGTSLVAMRVVMKAARLGYKIVYKDVFECLTPQALAELLGATTADSNVKDAPASSAPVAQEPLSVAPDGYDYTAIDQLLQSNTIANIHSADVRNNLQSLGACVVTGATGYLGIHIVKELIDRDDVPAIYCLVRSAKAVSALSRLRTQLFYYFDDPYDELWGKRLFIIEGDVTKTDWHDEVIRLIDSLPVVEGRGEALTVFNCAANVKHFSAGTDIEDINIGGCQSCIDFCLKTGARLIQTSTHSIEGRMESDKPVSGLSFKESMLYVGQTESGQYTQSKFIAERNVLEAVASKGLDAKIMRYGNLAARSTDGEFQINFSSNGFMNRLNVYKTLGAIPYGISAGLIEFSPINEVAHATVLLAMTPRQFTVFMPINCHHEPMSDVITCMRKLGFKIDDVEKDVFDSIVLEAGQDSQKAAIIQSLLAYTPNTHGRYVTNNTSDYSFTTQMLMRLGFNWSFTTWDYMERMITAIQGLGFFDEDYHR